MKEYEEKVKGKGISKLTQASFLARREPETFQKKYSYMEDAFERKEDMRKLDYQRRAALILDKNQAYTSSVKQHGTFDPFRKTYGSAADFPQKPKYAKPTPRYGPFRMQNVAKSKPAELIGGNSMYIEDPLEDTVAYQKDVKGPIWRDPTNCKSTPFKPMSSNYRVAASPTPKPNVSH